MQTCLFKQLLGLWKQQTDIFTDNFLAFASQAFASPATRIRFRLAIVSLAIQATKFIDIWQHTAQLLKLFLIRRSTTGMTRRCSQVSMPSTASEAVEPSRQHQRDLMQLAWLQVTKILDLNGLSAPNYQSQDVKGFGIDKGEDNRALPRYGNDGNRTRPHIYRKMPPNMSKERGVIRQKKFLKMREIDRIYGIQTKMWHANTESKSAEGFDLQAQPEYSRAICSSRTSTALRMRTPLLSTWSGSRSRSSAQRRSTRLLSSKKMLKISLQHLPERRTIFMPMTAPTPWPCLSACCIISLSPFNSCGANLRA